MIEHLLEPDFTGRVGTTVDRSTPAWPELPTPGPDAPNVVVIVLDDVGFAQLGCYGSDISTPHIDGLAASGLRYTNFHVTPLCSPTRACILTGRNHHSVGMGMISGFPSGFPNGREAVSHRAAMIPAALRAEGYGTYAVGKWHLVPMADMTPAGRFDHWPLSHGFDRFYGFLGGETDQYRPNLYVDNHVATPPQNPGYHLSEDLVAQAETMLSGHRSAAPDRPFFLYLAFGACHGPHQVPEPYRSRYRGRYDDGWDATRERWHRRQLELGVIPPGTGLAPRNPDVEPWASFDPAEQARFAEFQEVFAGFLEHTDAQVGRVLATLDALECAGNTIVMVMSDNGAAGEAGPRGTWNELIPFNGLSDAEAATLDVDEELGSPATYPLYPSGWAQVGNTPLKWYKHHTFGGGVRAPLIVRWPGHTAAGGVRSRFQHAIDITPTILDAAGVDFPEVVDGVAQLPVHGESFLDQMDERPSVDSAGTPGTGRVQYFEMQGHRGIFDDGWKAVTMHTAGEPFESDRWELYRLDEDFAELNDLAEAEPDRLARMKDLWWHEAGRHGVTPLDDRFLERAQDRRGTDNEGRTRFRYFRGTPRISESAGAEIRAGAFTMVVQLDGYVPGDEGVLVAFGGRFSGLVLFVENDHLCFDHNSYTNHTHLRSRAAIPAGTATVGIGWAPVDDEATVDLLVDGAPDASVRISRPVPFYAGGNGFEVGGNWLSRVSDRYEMPFEYTGRFRHVTIDASGTDLDTGGARRAAARAD
ncbi:MAG: arylsulfatase [Acidimicrobiales bacterium]